MPTSNNQRYLTKSRFKTAVECPTKLYYTGKSEYADTKGADEFLAMLADGGFQVGELAKLMYPGGEEIKAKINAEAVAETARKLQAENITLFEPAIVYQGYLVRVDVLVKRGRFIQVIEVKAKSYDGDRSSMTGTRVRIQSEYLPYIQDVAFQRYVVSSAFPESTVTAHLLMPDKTKTAMVNGMNQWFKVKRNGRQTEVEVDPKAQQPGVGESVLTVVDVDDLVNDVLTNPIAYPGGPGMLDRVASDWASAYAADIKIPPVLGAQCGKCEFKAPIGDAKRSGFHECWKDVLGWGDQEFAQGTVLDLWNFKKKQSLIEAGTFQLNRVKREDLGLDADEYSPISNRQRQWLQVAGLAEEDQARGYFLDDAGLASEARSWTYPLHLIDFETASVALPFHSGRRPYEQVAFQFSHHMLEANGELKHCGEFLCDAPGEFPNYAFVRALREALQRDRGTIMRWSHHENSILNAIAKQLQEDADPPDDADDLLAFIADVTKGGARAMVDLAEMARKYYFHPSTKGSNSIKKVLPAVMQSSRFLRQAYGQPIYGAEGGIPSTNFRDMAWWQQDEQGAVIDPYQLLLQAEAHLDDVAEDFGSGINQGGAASYAYLRLQFESLSTEERSYLRQSLLKYCELDTLAMAFILQAWQQG